MLISPLYIADLRLKTLSAMKAINLLALVWFIAVFVISGLSINFCQVVIRPLLWVAPDFYRRINAKLLYLLFHRKYAYLGKALAYVFMEALCVFFC